MNRTMLGLMSDTGGAVQTQNRVRDNLFLVTEWLRENRAKRKPTAGFHSKEPPTHLIVKGRFFGTKPSCDEALSSELPDYLAMICILAALSVVVSAFSTSATFNSSGKSAPGF